MAKSTIDIDIEFEETPTDLSNCVGCDDVIYGKMFLVVCSMELEERKRVKLQLDGLDIKLCESCRGIYP